MSARRLAALLLPLALCCGSDPAPAASGPQTLEVAGSTIELHWDPAAYALGADGVEDWIRTSARAVASYYGTFPLPRVRLELRDVPGSGVRTGRTDGGAYITVVVGRASSRDDLRRDWVLTHEMVHLAFPSLSRQHHWMEEGLATYVEPFARLEIGELEPEKVWGDLVDGLPNGLPRAGDRGLDFTPTWGRTYWGGALYFLLADLEIHKRTHNAKGLRDALRAIRDAGGTARADWSIEQTLQVGDRATGVPVLAELYARMRADPAPVDLDALWRELGVEETPSGVRFHNTTPLAAARLAISLRPREQ